MAEGAGTGLAEEGRGWRRISGMLATVSMFLGGLSLAMICIPALGDSDLGAGDRAGDRESEHVACGRGRSPGSC